MGKKTQRESPSKRQQFVLTLSCCRAAAKGDFSYNEAYNLFPNKLLLYDYRTG